ncbi:MAG: hypothetical protein H0X62_13000 [Bacteroidetes bacterium]|nr:hypothetical protein [Bacteroidota bacterium]
MKKTSGIILTVVGLVAIIITGMDAIQQAESFSFLGLDVVVSQGNYIPVIISLIVAISGVALLASSRGK